MLKFMKLWPLSVALIFVLTFSRSQLGVRSMFLVEKQPTGAFPNGGEDSYLLLHQDEIVQDSGLLRALAGASKEEVEQIVESNPAVQDALLNRINKIVQVRQREPDGYAPDIKAQHSQQEAIIDHVEEFDDYEEGGVESYGVNSPKKWVKDKWAKEQANMEDAAQALREKAYQWVKISSKLRAKFREMKDKRKKNKDKDKGKKKGPGISMVIPKFYIDVSKSKFKEKAMKNGPLEEYPDAPFEGPSDVPPQVQPMYQVPPGAMPPFPPHGGP